MIKLPIHESTVYIEVKKTNNELQKRAKSILKKFKIEEEEDCIYEAICITNLSKTYILFSEEKLTENIISHEIYHATIDILHDNEEVNDEEHARLNGYLNQEVRKYIKKKWQIKDI